LCVDLCGVNAVSGANPSVRAPIDPVGVADVGLEQAEDVVHPRPTDVLIPHPNAPPHAV
jgi:hypothetical protein